MLKKKQSKQFKPLASSEPVKEPEQQATALVKEVLPTPPVIKDKPKAVAKIRKISTRERAENWFNQGKEAFQFGLIEDAIAALDKALILMPLHIEARSLMSAAYYGREQITRSRVYIKTWFKFKSRCNALAYFVS